MHGSEDHDDVDLSIAPRASQRRQRSPGNGATTDPTRVGNDPADPFLSHPFNLGGVFQVRRGKRTTGLGLSGIKHSRNGRWANRQGPLLGAGHGFHYN